MSRAEERKKRKEAEKKALEQAGYWPELIRSIKTGQVIPIISNAVFNDHIFDIDGDKILGISPDEKKTHLSIEEQLAREWSIEIEYPLDENYILPKVAQYHRVVISQSDGDSKQQYLDWLKDYLLDLASEDPDIEDEKIEELRSEYKHNSFSYIVTELEYPKPIKDYIDPLVHLAKLQLPIYITTSPFDFLERAIRKNKGEPRTQICFWQGEPNKYLAPSHKTDYDFQPTAKTPLVYHLFGFEDYPESMVLNEDDYLDFLGRLARDSNQKTPILPSNLLKAITKSPLLLLGYRMRDLDFRVMFRGLIANTPSGFRKDNLNLSLQFDPQNQDKQKLSKEIRDYLEKYFDKADFDVEFDTTQRFIKRIWDEWSNQ